MTCNGCKQEATARLFSDRRLASVEGDERRVENITPDVVLVVVANFSKELAAYHGVKTGRLYGYVHNGHVFPIAREDFEADKRVAKATPDTLRLFA